MDSLTVDIIAKKGQGCFQQVQVRNSSWGMRMSKTGQSIYYAISVCNITSVNSGRGNQAVWNNSNAIAMENYVIATKYLSWNKRLLSLCVSSNELGQASYLLIYSRRWVIFACGLYNLPQLLMNLDANVRTYRVRMLTSNCLIYANRNMFHIVGFGPRGSVRVFSRFASCWSSCTWIKSINILVLRSKSCTHLHAPCVYTE